MRDLRAKREKCITLFQARAVDRLARMGARLSEFQRGEADAAPLAEEFARDLDAIKGEALLLGLKATVQMADPIEERFASLRESGFDPSSSHLTSLLDECSDLALALEEGVPSSDRIGAPTVRPLEWIAEEE